MSKYFNQTLFAERLQKLMEAQGDTTYALASFLGLSAATISRYASGLMAPKVPTIQAIAEKYGVSPNWLMGIEGAERLSEVTTKCKRIPIVGTIAAGSPIIAEENIVGYEYVDITSSIDFALVVRGDSMINARIFDGDLVYIRQQSDVENGEIGAVLIDGEATLKKIYKREGMVILKPENPRHQEKIFVGPEMAKLRIIGKAIFLKAKLN